MEVPNSTNSFYRLEPELVLQATEEAGFSPTGEFTQLNSYENRVFDIKLEPSASEDARSNIIAKFYRPGRWSQNEILEEHSFLDELEKEGLTVAAALKQRNSTTVSVNSGMLTAFFPKIQGRLPQEFQDEDLVALGKKMALLHNVGDRRPFSFRAALGDFPHNPYENLDFVLSFVSPEIRTRYESICEELIGISHDLIDASSFQRIHGDLHRGNILHNGKLGRDSEFFFVDFDDSVTGPIIQDFWMLFSSAEFHSELQLILKGYEALREFPSEQLVWIPLLRGLRILNYATWIARRWTDPNFPKIFPQFGSYSYWAEEVEALEKIVWSLA